VCSSELYSAPNTIIVQSTSWQQVYQQVYSIMRKVQLIMNMEVSIGIHHLNTPIISHIALAWGRSN
jgi:hypothetical protein